MNNQYLISALRSQGQQQPQIVGPQSMFNPQAAPMGATGGQDDGLSKLAAGLGKYLGHGAGAGAGGAGSATMGALGPVAGFGLGAQALNDAGISSYGDTLSGRAPSKIIDYATGGNADNALGNFGKSMGGLAMGNIGDFAKNGVKSAKDFFSLNWF